MKVKEVMRTNPTTIPIDETFRMAIDIFCKEKIDGIPIINKNNEIEGIITRSHAFRLMARKIELDSPIANIMTKNIITIHPEENVTKLITWNISTLPVAENNKIVGLVTLSETIQAYYSSVLSLQQELNSVIDSTHNGIISINEKEVIVIINQAAINALGLNNKNVIGKKITDVMVGSNLADVLKIQEFSYGQKVTINGKNFLSNSNPIINNGVVTGAVEVIQDLSELEELSEELVYTKALKEELTAIIQSSFDGILVTDEKGVIIRINDSLIRIMGLTEDELIGTNLNDHNTLGSYFTRVINNEQPNTISYNTAEKDEVLITANPIYNDNGTLMGTVANVRDMTELRHLENQLTSLNELYEKERRKFSLGNKFVFKSPKAKDLIELVLHVAEVDSTVLILGESGVGKEIVASILHSNSNRSDKPFVRVNCGAIPENLIESELFGYESGAFTGAKKSGKMGLFEVADHGVIFLDEIGELPLNLQVKLLRVLQESEITPVGGISSRKVNVRIIAATNRDIKQMVKEKKFREDLYYRLNVVPIVVPPLRDRQEDIPELAGNFINKLNKKYDMNKSLDKNVIEQLISYDWPGNIRELENLIERTMVTTKEDIINSIKLPNKEKQDNLNSYFDIDSITFNSSNYKEIVNEFEKRLLQQALDKYGSTRKAASVIGLEQSTIVRKASRLGITFRNK